MTDSNTAQIRGTNRFLADCEALMGLNNLPFFHYLKPVPSTKVPVVTKNGKTCWLLLAHKIKTGREILMAVIVVLAAITT